MRIQQIFHMEDIMNLEQLQSVKALATYKNYSIAADELFVAQSTLTKRIQSLEQELGVQLFNRGPKGAALSPIGNKIYQNILDILTLSDEIQKTILADARGQNRCHIYCVPSLHVKNLSQKIISFRNENPMAEILVSEEDIDTLLTLLQSSSEVPDILIVRSPWVEKIPYEKAMELINDELVLVCSPNHPLASQNFVVPSDLSHYSISALTKALSDYSSILRNHSVSLHVEFSCASTHTLQAFIENSMTISIMTRYAASDLPNQGAIVCVPFKERLDCSLYMLIPHGITNPLAWLLFEYVAASNM